MFVCCLALTLGKTQKKKKIEIVIEIARRALSLPSTCNGTRHGRVSDGLRVSLYRVDFFQSFTVILEKRYTFGQKFLKKNVTTFPALSYNLLAATFKLPLKIFNVVSTEK